MEQIIKPDMNNPQNLFNMGMDSYVCFLSGGSRSHPTLEVTVERIGTGLFSRIYFVDCKLFQGSIKWNSPYLSIDTSRKASEIFGLAEPNMAKDQIDGLLKHHYKIYKFKSDLKTIYIVAAATHMIIN